MLKQQKFKILLISDLIIQRQTIASIAQLINNQNAKQNDYTLIAKSLSNNQDFDLRLALLTQINFKRVSDKLLLGQKWVLCEQSELGIIEIKVDGILIFGQSPKLKGSNIQKVLKVKTLSQGVGIICMSTKQLNIRLKMQKLLTFSKNKYQNNQHIQNFKFMASYLCKKYVKTSIKHITKALNFYGHYRLRILRKYFIQWTIAHYELVINKKQEQLISGDFITQGSNKKLLQKCFKGWKAIAEQRKLRIT